MDQNELFHTLARPLPPGAYKDLQLGGRTMTVIDAYHIVSRLTQVFGLCGSGWGVKVTDWDLSPDGSNLAASGSLWYKLDDKRCSVPAIGDARVFKGNVAEARKKAQTNLISKASSFIGIGLSVYQGKGIDDPYLDEVSLKEDRKPPKLKAEAWLKATTLKGKPLADLSESERDALYGWAEKTITQSLSDDGFRLWHLVLQMRTELAERNAA